ncbi:MAG TPA: undecaprenyl-diphosphate phosphatase [Bacteroidia bacterium]|jgi:undecaprenyl-diphosphatase|nr:undecaprenyl-diphosphate phosphatase [Bacteroidia bacterium]
MNYFQSVLLGIIEGLTEFIPVSSTGHMVIASSGMGIAKLDFTKTFTVAIQLGAILSVVVLYWRKFIKLNDFRFYIKLAIAVIPALVIGKLLSDFIDEKLGNPVFIACSILAGGIVLLFVDNWFKGGTIKEEKEISLLKAFFIGCWQVLALVFPGMSRSAASIVGGMQQKLTRDVAAEFSFFLAVPTMLAATGYKLYKHVKLHGMFTHDEIKLLAVGNLVAFVVALFAIKVFITMVKKYGFRMWGYYRIVLGVAVLVTNYFFPLTVL